MSELIVDLFSVGDFMPHGHCYLWQPGLVWLHIISDLVIALAYYSIPLTLFYFVEKRRDLPFNWIFILFAAFIVSCGTTHLLEVWTLWHPVYWLSGSLKAVTALISLYIAFKLVQLIPQALALPSHSQLSELNQKLQQQIYERQQAEVQIRQLNQNLEAKVAQRTRELEDSMVQVRGYVERAALAMDAAKMGSWDWDLATQKVIWSGYHTILFGYPLHYVEHTYEDWARRVHPDDLASIEAAVQTAMATRTDYAAEYRVIWDDGTVHWLAAFGRFYYSPGGDPFRMTGMLYDVTKRKQAEASLLQSEERLRLATEAANIGMWFWNISAQELVWTPHCKTLFGLDPDIEPSYERFLAALHPDDRACADAAVQAALANHTEYVIEFRSLWQDGSIHWLISQGRAFYNEQGQPVRMMGMAQDVTERKQAEIDRQAQNHQLSQMNILLLQTTALLNQRNQELDQFTHIVSHDLKAPLRAIANLSEWIEADLTDQVPPDTKQNLELLRSRVRRMDDLINGLLAYARITHQETLDETFSLNELLTEIIDSLDIPPDFTIQLPPELPPLMTNRFLLSQVLTNLISNAVKHHDRPDGHIKVMAQVQAEGYAFTVSDDGPGITPKNHSQVFDIFQTLTSLAQKENTGIGLAIVKKIIERAGGQISLESDVGQGSTFHFTWPIAQM